MARNHPYDLSGHPAKYLFTIEGIKCESELILESNNNLIDTNRISMKRDLKRYDKHRSNFTQTQ